MMVLTAGTAAAVNVRTRTTKKKGIFTRATVEKVGLVGMGKPYGFLGLPKRYCAALCSYRIPSLIVGIVSEDAIKC